MLVQLHWQNVSNPKQTEFIAQGEFEDYGSMLTWISRILDERMFEVPDGWTPMICNEKSREFESVSQKEIVMKKAMEISWLNYVLVVVAGLILGQIAAADEPPQCNLPGWQAAKADGCDCRNCKCGVACDCADDAFTVAHKAKPAKASPAKVQGPSYAIERRYKRIGKRLFVEDVLVEVSQPATLSYAAVPTQAVNYQSPKMDCSSGTCRYVR